MCLKVHLQARQIQTCNGAVCGFVGCLWSSRRLSVFQDKSTIFLDGYYGYIYIRITLQRLDVVPTIFMIGDK